jgi:raffinose/stachyose/melibiose transport system permease protein
MATLATQLRRNKGGGAPRFMELRRHHYLYLLPAVVLFAVFVVYPVVEVVRTSVTLHDTASHGTGLFANFLSVLTDGVFWIAARNMLYWAALTIFVQMIIGGVLAYLIETYTRRSRSWFRTVFFVPVVTSVSVIAIVWSQIYAPEYGPLQWLLAKFGFHLTYSVLGSPNTAIFGCIAVNIWEFTGFSMLLYIVGLHRIPTEVLDAAKIDGSTGWSLARRVLAPMLSGVTKSLLLLGIIGTLQTFPLVYLMTSGGPNQSSQIFGTYIFQKAFIEDQNGYASALSVIVLVIAFVSTALQVRLLKSNIGIGRG